MLARVVDRVRRAETITRVIVATTTQPQDDVLAAHAGELAVDVYRGDEDDVLDRYYQAAVRYQLDVVARITSDCPLLDPALADDVVRLVLAPASGVDYAANTLKRTFPRGLDVEAVPFTTLERVWREARSLHQRAHVFPYVHDRPELFSMAGVVDADDWSYMRWTVDTHEDLVFVRQVCRALGTLNFTWRDVVTVLRQHPEFLHINEHVRQKTAHEV